jgi:hypothetical protein
MNTVSRGAMIIAANTFSCRKQHRTFRPFDGKCTISATTFPILTNPFETEPLHHSTHPRAISRSAITSHSQIRSSPMPSLPYPTISSSAPQFPQPRSQHYNSLPHSTSATYRQTTPRAPVRSLSGTHTPPREASFSVSQPRHYGAATRFQWDACPRRP